MATAADAGTKPEASVPPELIAEGIVLLLAVVSVAMALFIAYILFLRISKPPPHLPQHRRELWPQYCRRALSQIGWAGPVLFVAIGFFLRFAHNQTDAQGWLTKRIPDLIGTPVPAVQVLATALALFVAMAAGAILYFGFVRRTWIDDRIRYAILLWSALWLLTGFVLLVLWRVSSYISFNIAEMNAESFASYISTFAQVAGILIAATMVIVTNAHNAREADETARDQIYQTLELESIKLFRFEAQYPELVRRLWYPETPARPNPLAPLEGVQDYLLKQYTCQILNLFEMACSFRHKRIIDPNVFGSWVIWMWELCCEPAFRRQWDPPSHPGDDPAEEAEEPIEFNYVVTLRNIINAGIEYATARPEQMAVDTPAMDENTLDEHRMRSFFRYVAAEMIDPDIEGDPQAYAEIWLLTKDQKEHEKSARKERLKVYWQLELSRRNIVRTSEE